MHLWVVDSVEFFCLVVLTVMSKSETVSSIRKLGACHLAGKSEVDVLLHIQPWDGDSVEVFCLVVLTVKVESETVSWIIKLGTYHPWGKTQVKGMLHIHPWSIDFVELWLSLHRISKKQKDQAHCHIIVTWRPSHDRVTKWHSIFEKKKMRDYEFDCDEQVEMLTLWIWEWHDWNDNI